MAIKDWFSTLLGQSKEASDNQTILWVTDSQPIFKQFGKDIYYSDFVNDAISRVATEVSKINVRSVVKKENYVQTEYDDITSLFDTKPNPLQAASDFWANVEWLRRKHGNVFIYPQYHTIKAGGHYYKRYTAFYPLNPVSFRVGVDTNGNAWEVEMQFKGKHDIVTYTVPYQDLIHLKWRRGTNTILGGGNDQGKIDNSSMQTVVEAMDQTIQGLPKSIAASLQVKGVYSATSLMDADKIKKTRDKFEEHIFTSKTGVVATDLVGNFTPINISPAEIPKDTLDFLKATISQRYGVSPAILSGDYNSDQHSAFYQTAIEDFIIQVEQVMTAALYNKRELGLGHRIKVYYNKVDYYSVKDKLQLANLAKETGILTLNEINEVFGITPFKGGDRRLQSLNFSNMELVDDYQRERMKVWKERYDK